MSDIVERLNDSLSAGYSELRKEAAAEITRLRARVEEMKRQEPVGTAFLCVQCNTPFDGEYYCPKCGGHTATEENVYALPGAKGE